MRSVGCIANDAFGLLAKLMQFARERDTGIAVFSIIGVVTAVFFAREL
jgi:hypothetical protein